MARTIREGWHNRGSIKRRGWYEEMTADKPVTKVPGRMRTLTPGDPVSDYYGFPEVQLEIIRSEIEEQKTHTATAENQQTTTTHHIGEVAVTHGGHEDWQNRYAHFVEAA